MKKILSLITLVIMVFSLLTMSVSAINGYDTVNDNVKLEAKVTMVNSTMGKAQITFYLTTSATDFSAGAPMYDSDWQMYSDGKIKGFTTAGVSYTPNSTVFKTSAGTKQIVTLAAQAYTIEGNATPTAAVILDLTDDYKSYTADQLNAMDIITVTLATAEIKEYTCSGGSATLSKHTSYRTDGNGDFDIEVTVPKAAGSTDIIVDDEDFSSATEDNYTSKDVTSGNVKVGENTPIAMGEGGKIYTYFNKTATTLEAGKYGIDATINGKKFRFPGKVDVTIASGETEAKWAIKLVIPTGKFSDNVAASVTDIADYYITD